MKEEILQIAEQDNFTIAEVRTLLRVSNITDDKTNLLPKYCNVPIRELWDTIPNKKELLELWNSIKGKRKRRRKNISPTRK
jgi:hypothetical protein